MEIALFFLIMFILLKIIDLYYQKHWAKELGVTVQFSADHAETGDTVVLEERVINNKSIPLPYINIKFKSQAGIRYPSSGDEEKVSDQTYRNDIFSLLFHQKVVRRLPVKCEKRGEYNIDEIQVVSKSFLLNSTMVLRIAQDLRITVFPKRVFLEDVDPCFHSLTGDSVIPKHLLEDPFQFSGIRDYQTYDTLSSINWNATARAGKLQVNQHDETTEKTVYLILNLDNEGMFDSNDLHELGISIAAGLSYHYLQAGFQVGMICNGKDIDDTQIPLYPQADGMEQFNRINTGLAKIDLSKDAKEMISLLHTVSKEYFSHATNILISPKRNTSRMHVFDEVCDMRSDGIWIETYHDGNTCRAKIHTGKDAGEQ